MRNFFLILLWILSLVVVSMYINEHPEKIEEIKQYFQKFNDPDIKLEKTNTIRFILFFFSGWKGIWDLKFSS